MVATRRVTRRLTRSSTVSTDADVSAPPSPVETALKVTKKTSKTRQKSPALSAKPRKSYELSPTDPSASTTSASAVMKPAIQRILDEIDVECESRMAMLRNMVDTHAVCLRTELNVQLLKIPRAVRSMPVSELQGEFAGDVTACIKRQQDHSKQKLASFMESLRTPYSVRKSTSAPKSASGRAGSVRRSFARSAASRRTNRLTIADLVLSQNGEKESGRRVTRRLTMSTDDEENSASSKSTAPAVKGTRKHVLTDNAPTTPLVSRKMSRVSFAAPKHQTTKSSNSGTTAKVLSDISNSPRKDSKTTAIAKSKRLAASKRGPKKANAGSKNGVEELLGGQAAELLKAMDKNAAMQQLQSLQAQVSSLMAQLQ